MKKVRGTSESTLGSGQRRSLWENDLHGEAWWGVSRGQPGEWGGRTPQGEEILSGNSCEELGGRWKQGGRNLAIQGECGKSWPHIYQNIYQVNEWSRGTRESKASKMTASRFLVDRASKRRCYQSFCGLVRTGRAIWREQSMTWSSGFQTWQRVNPKRILN